MTAYLAGTSLALQRTEKPIIVELDCNLQSRSGCPDGQYRQQVCASGTGGGDEAAPAWETAPCIQIRSCPRISH